MPVNHYAEVPAFIDQVNAAGIATMFAQVGAISQQGMAFMTEQSRGAFVANQGKVDVREAIGMQEARQSSQAREILQANAAQVSPREPVIVKTT